MMWTYRENKEICQSTFSAAAKEPLGHVHTANMSISEISAYNSGLKFPMYTMLCLSGIYLCGVLFGTSCYGLFKGCIHRYILLIAKETLNLYQNGSAEQIFSIIFISHIVSLSAILLLCCTNLKRCFVPIFVWCKAVSAGCFFYSIITYFSLKSPFLIYLFVFWPAETANALLSIVLSSLSLQMKGSNCEASKRKPFGFFTKYRLFLIFFIVSCACTIIIAIASSAFAVFYRSYGFI